MSDMGGMRKYCIAFVLTTIFLGVVVATANALIDPFGMYRVFDRPDINARKPAIHQRVRLAKAYEVRRIAPRAIVLGTSRSHIGIRMTHPGWTASPRYNLAFDGATAREMYAYLVHAQATQPLSLVVVGLDTWHLSDAPSGTRPGFDATLLLDKPGLFSHLKLVPADLGVLISSDTLIASWETLHAQESTDAEWLAPDGQRLGEVFFRRAGELFHDESPRAYFEAYDREEIGWRKPAKPSATSVSSSAEPAVSTSSLEWIYRIVAFCRTNRIDLRLYITPAHAHQLEMTAATDEWQRLASSKRRLVSYLADDATRYPDRPPVPLWDFSGYSSVTTEALPSAGSQAEMRYYWDSSHFKVNVGDWVLDRVLGKNADQHLPPPDFGVQLTEKNIDAVLYKDQMAHREYARMRPFEVGTIQRLMRADAQPPVEALVKMTSSN